MTHRQRILEGIDACRPASDDIRDPDLAFLAGELERDPQTRGLYQLGQKLDASIAAALNDIPVPQDLSQRILARLAAAQPAIEVPPELQPSAHATNVEPASLDQPRRSRRWLLGTAIGGAVAAGLATVIAKLPSRPAVTQENLDDFVREFFKGEQNVAAGIPIDQQAPPTDFPPSSLLSIRGNMRWRKVAGLLDTRGVAYDLAQGGRQGRATLYVLPIPSTMSGLGNSPPRRPSTTAGVAIGAWQENGRLYVLAVSGGENEYRQFLRSESIA